MFDFINFTDPHILSYVRTIGYPTMLLIMIVEGPIMTVLAAFMASFGIFNVFFVFLLSIFGDMAGDIILYYIGYVGGSRTLEKAEALLKIKPERIEKIKKLFAHHGKKTIFLVKSTTGLCWITFIAAGTVKMRLKEFMQASFLGGIVWSSFLVISGYFFGYAYERINEYIKYASILIFVSAVIFYVILTIYKRYVTKKVFNNG